MSSLNNIVLVNITANSSAPKQKNFGVPLALAYHTHNTDLVRTYNDVSDMISDGFSQTEPAFLMAEAIVSQNPRPPKFKVGRLTTAVAQTFTFTVTDNTTGDKVGFSILDNGGVVHDLFHTVSSETLNQVATALALVIAAVPGVASSVAVGAVITTTLTTAGQQWYPSLVPNNSANFRGGFQGGTFADTTADSNTEDDLAAIALVDPDFYGVAIQQIDHTNIQNTATWVEANGRLLAYVTADTNNLTAGSGVGFTLMGLSYKRSFGVFSQTPAGFVALGIMSQRLTAVPGSDTWAFKTAVGAFPDDNLTPTQLTNLQSNNLNFYTTIAGLVVLTDGRSAQGQFMDIQRGLDALAADMQARVFGLLASSEKIPYTTAGMTMVGTQMRASLKSFTASPASPNLFLSNDPGFAPVVTLPNIADVSPADKKNRVLRNANFTATATGAIQTVIINGTLSF